MRSYPGRDECGSEAAGPEDDMSIKHTAESRRESRIQKCVVAVSCTLISQPNKEVESISDMVNGFAKRFKIDRDVLIARIKDHAKVLSARAKELK